MAGIKLLPLLPFCHPNRMVMKLALKRGVEGGWEWIVWPHLKETKQSQILANIIARLPCVAMQLT
jgi:hypothetical protein